MTPEDKKRFAKWVAHISDFKRVRTQAGFKFVGTGISDLTEGELQAVLAIPCKYRRAARASRA